MLPAHMTYIDLINQFWQKDLEYSFSSTEVDVYFRLLDHCNKLGWKSPFNLSVEKLMAQMGLHTKKPLDTARKRLRDAGLLDFENGNGRGCTTKYALAGVATTLERVPERGNKNTPLLGTLSVQFRDSSGADSGLLHKSKIKSKTKEATASVSEQSASLTPAPIAEPWAAWLADNAPTVQRLKHPLTAEQYAKLVADFGEPLMREVLASMENHAGLLKKYTSANLTARDWCKRRCPNGKLPTPAPLPAAGPAQPITPDLNPEVIAQRQAQRDAEAAEARRRLRTSSQPG
jgi:hypothetical protein